MAYSSTLILVDYNSSVPLITLVVETFSFDVEQLLNIGSQGSGAGKITFNPLSITRFPDLVTPVLFGHCASGTAFKQAIITVTPSGGSVPAVTYRMGLVAIKTLSAAGNQHGGPLPIETVTFEYGGLQIVVQDPVTNQTAIGSWDRVTNVNSFPY